MMLEGRCYPPVVDIKAESQRGYITCPNRIANKWWGQDLNPGLSAPRSIIRQPLLTRSWDSWLQVLISSLACVVLNKSHNLFGL